ncbi:MAG: homoserine dehydrogenase [Clostridiales bacterium]|nr:homoserine dehydrogenase [Clostridiales bacterium]
MLKKAGVAILGLGVVGGGTYEILTKNKEYFKKTQGVDITVQAVLEKNKERALSLGIEESKIASSIEEVCSNPEVDIVVEVIGGTGVAKTFVKTALMSGKTVVTSNKELFAKHWPELEAEAKKMNAGLFFEASCVGGVPIIRTLIDGMQANKILSIKGIINGTTNYILTKMAYEGWSYEEALKEAQRLGYAEFDPTADVEGFDATYKLSILSSLAFNKKICIENVYREGITAITKEDIAQGKEMGYTLKLLGIGKDTEKGVEVRVHPTFIKNDNPLASVNDSFNAVHLVGDAVGEIMLYGRGAGALPTGSAIVSDIIFAAKHNEYFYASFKNNAQGNKETKFVKDFTSKYYIRLTVKDMAGVLAKIATTFAKNNISIAEVKQVGGSDNSAQIVVNTHVCAEGAVKKTLDKLSTLPEMIKVNSVIRIED